MILRPVRRPILRGASFAVLLAAMAAGGCPKKTTPTATGEGSGGAVTASGAKPIRIAMIA